MSFIYTHNTSPRRFKKVIKNKSYYEAVDKQNKLLRSIGIDPHRTIRRDSFKVMPLEQVGKLQTFSSNTPDTSNWPKDYKSSGTKPVTNEKLAISSQYTIAPAYNKGPSMVVGKKDIKDIGR